MGALTQFDHNLGTVILGFSHLTTHVSLLVL